MVQERIFIVVIIIDVMVIVIIVVVTTVITIVYMVIAVAVHSKLHPFRVNTRPLINHKNTFGNPVLFLTVSFPTAMEILWKS